MKRNQKAHEKRSHLRLPTNRLVAPFVTGLDIVGVKFVEDLNNPELVHKERTETFTLPREIRVEPDCGGHINVTDALKKLVVENGESQVRVTVKGSPDYAINQREGIFLVAAHKGRFSYFGFDHFSN